MLEMAWSMALLQLAAFTNLDVDARWQGQLTPDLVRPHLLFVGSCGPRRRVCTLTPPGLTKFMVAALRWVIKWAAVSASLALAGR
jgi:hypothetical protein